MGNITQVLCARKLYFDGKSFFLILSWMTYKVILRDQKQMAYSKYKDLKLSKSLYTIGQ